MRWAIDLISPAASLLLASCCAEQSVVYVPGRSCTPWRAFRGEANRRQRCAVIADTARLRSDLTELTLTDELVVELTQLTSYRPT